MKIAYHNPWVDAAENQSFSSLGIAAGKLGVKVFACLSHEDIDACDPDFVLSVSSSVPKLVDRTSYLTVHAPPGFFHETPGHMRNLLSYDGWLTISDSIRRFLGDLCFGVGRRETPGFYYNCPQLTDLRADWSASLAAKARVVYLGTNWDRRMPGLFQALDRARILRIYGPAAAWSGEGHDAYRGALAFDGVAPQRIYAEYGLGLALLGDRWWREDVISNRIFEIASVGAVAICPDMPWTRKWFGDAVLYFDATETAPAIARQVIRHYEFCRADPARARSIGEAAREIFEQHFSAERMLSNLLEYHQRKTVERSRRASGQTAHPDISVIVRCGGRPLSLVKRAVDSIRRQRFGRFTVIFVRYADIDLAPIISDVSGAICSFAEVSIPGGGRAETLFRGVQHAASAYFAVLDDDDFWLSEHMEELFRAGRQVRFDFDMAFSGSVAFDFPIFYRENQFCSRNILLFGFAAEPNDVFAIPSAIGTNCFVARRDLLTDGMLEPPDMDTAEDSLLIALLARRSKPIFSYRATAFYRRGAADGAQFASHPNRARDEMTLALRAGLAWTPEWLHKASFELSTRTWSEVGLPALPRQRDGPVLQDAANPGAGDESGERIRALEQRVADLLNSRSWRVTAPLRSAAMLARRPLHDGLLPRLGKRSRADPGNGRG